MARGRLRDVCGPDARDQRELLTWGFYVGAGDGKRTRTISLEIRQIGASDRLDLDIRCTASDRHRPYGTRSYAGRPSLGRTVMLLPRIRLPSNEFQNESICVQWRRFP